LLDAVCDLLSKVPFSLFQPGGHVGSAGTELLAKGGIKAFDVLCNFRLYIELRRLRNPPQQNQRKPKQDKGSGEHENEK
jgi:hypothetical protein